MNFSIPIDKIDSWLIGNLQEFNPLGQTIDKDCFFRRKTFDELAILAYVSEYWKPETDKSLSEHLIQIVNKPEYGNLIKRNSNQVLLYSFPVIYAKHKGRLDEYTRDSIDYALKRKSLWAKERLPHRYLDLWHFCKVYGFENNLNPQILIELSCLVKLDPVDCSLEDAYALTHVLLFYYNFGIDFPDSKIKLLHHNLEDLLCSLILRFIAEDNNDIILELLYVGAIHRQIPYNIAELVLFKTNRELKEKGFISSPESIITENLTLVNPTSRNWSENYHTMLVAGTTFRYLQGNWENIAERTRKDSPILECTPEELLHFGYLLQVVNNYELTKAIRITEKLLVSPLSDFPAFQSVIRFLKEQIDHKGNFGFFVDEAVKYNKQAERNSFETELQPEINRVFKEFLKKLQ